MIGNGDLDLIFDRDFAEPVVFHIDPEDEETDLTVQAIFTEASQGVSLMGNVEVEASRPSLMVQTDEITTVRNRMAVTVREVDYTVEKIEPVGTGVSVVWLKT